MKGVQSDRSDRQTQGQALHSWARCLLVDVIPVLLLLLTMAFAMACLCRSLDSPSSEEFRVAAEADG